MWQETKRDILNSFPIGKTVGRLFPGLILNYVLPLREENMTSHFCTSRKNIREAAWNDQNNICCSKDVKMQVYMTALFHTAKWVPLSWVTLPSPR